MQDNSPTVFIVDDDHAVRDSLRILLKSVGIASESYSTADAFLSKYDSARTGCLILDVRMPGLSGPELQNELKTRGFHIPTIVVSGHGDIRVAVECVQAGALDFVEKPLRDYRILELVQKAFEQDIAYRDNQAGRLHANNLYASLSKREQEVFNALVLGKSIKVVAIELDISHKTVESHRSNIFRKLEVRGIADLMQISSVLAGNNPYLTT